jgi:hypothetical protein
MWIYFWNQYFLHKISTGIFEVQKEQICNTRHATISPTGVSNQHWCKKRTAVWQPFFWTVHDSQVAWLCHTKNGCSSLATGPRFVETWGVTAGGGYVTREKRESLCVAKTQQGLVAWCKPCSPGWKSCPSIRMIIGLGSLERCPPPSEGGDWCMYQAGIIPSSWTNCPFSHWNWLPKLKILNCAPWLMSCLPQIWYIQLIVLTWMPHDAAS